MRRATFPLLISLCILAALRPQAGQAEGLQSEARRLVSPDRQVDVEHLDLDLAVDMETRSIAGSATLRVRPLRDGTVHAVFHQVALQFSSVSVDGVEVPFHVGRDRVTVEFPEPASREQSYAIRLDYEARPTTGLHFRGPGPESPDSYVEAWTQGEDIDHRHWFPTWDDPSDRLTFRGAFSAPERFTVVSNGTLAGKEPSGDRPGWTTWTYELIEQDIVSYLVALAVAEYERYDELWRDVPLEYYAPPGTDEATVRRAAGKTAAMMDYFSEVTGIPYPYPVYRQIFVQRFTYGGMENTTATIMSDRLLHSEEAHPHRLAAERIVAHELAHQWYGDQLTCQTWREMWLNEGFATFFEALWTEHDQGAAVGAFARQRRYRGEIRADERGARPLVLRFFNDDGSGHRANPYGKGASVLRMLHVMLGDDVFFRGIQHYTRAHQHGLVETEDLRRSMQEVSGMNLDWFFDQWVYLVGHPVLEVRQEVDLEASRLRLSIRQTQEVGDRTPIFTLPIDVEIATSTGTRVERLWMDGSEAGAVFELDGELLWVAVDPRGGLLAEIEHSRSDEELLAALAGSQLPDVRVAVLWALEEREGTPSEEVRAAIAALLMDEASDLEWRLAAARVAGSWRDEGSAELLLGLLAAEQSAGGSSRLREAAVKALGRGRPDEPVVGVLHRVASLDPADWVRAAAVDALGALLQEGARSRALTALRARPTEAYVVQRAAARVLGRWGQSSDLLALAAFRRPAVKHGMRMDAMWASRSIADRQPLGTERDEARDPVARDAERMLEDLHIRSRQTAIGVLRSVGGARSVAALKAAARRENDPDLLKAIEGAIDAIRSREDVESDPVPGEVQARLERLEEELESLREDLSALEERP